MVGVSLVVLTGWGGHISLGQFAIVGVGRRRRREHGDQARRRPVRGPARRRRRRAASSPSCSACRRCASGACSWPSPRWPSPSPSTATSSTRRTSTTGSPRPDRAARPLAALPAGAGPGHVLPVPGLPRAVRVPGPRGAPVPGRAGADRGAGQPPGGGGGVGADHRRDPVGLRVLRDAGRDRRRPPRDRPPRRPDRQLPAGPEPRGVLHGRHRRARLRRRRAARRVLAAGPAGRRAPSTACWSPGRACWPSCSSCPAGSGQVAFNVRDRFLRFVAKRRGHRWCPAWWPTSATRRSTPAPTTTIPRTRSTCSPAR